MLTTLWIMTVASIAAMAAALAGRTSVYAARNRVELERAYWRAAGCARRAQAAMDTALDTAATPEQAALIWRMLNHAVAGSALIVGCNLSLEAAGTRLDLNAATDEAVANLAVALGYGNDEARAMADSLADWRHAEGSVRPLNDARELSRVRGFENLARFDSVVSVEPGRISLATAPITVLLAVPGVTAELATAIVARQQAGAPIADLSEALASVSEASAATLASRYSDAVRMTTADPDAWLLRSIASSGLPPNTFVLQWRLGRVGRRIVVLRVRRL
jgi:hypothetical protein